MRLSILNRLVSSSNTLLTHLQFAQQNAFFTIRINPFSSLSSPHNPSISKEQQQQQEQEQEQEQSFVVSYLIDSCGVTPERAKLLSSKYKLKFEDPDRPNSVLAILREHGFTDRHIAKVVSWDPRLLTNYKSPERTLLPKFEFFYSIGVSRDCLPDLVCNCSSLICGSLEGYIIPAYNFLRSVLSSEKEVVTILKRSPRFFMNKETRTTNVTANVEFLKGIGVPTSTIAYLMGLQGDALFLQNDEFCQCVNEVIDMGFDVSKLTFAWAVFMNCSETNKAVRDRSFKVYEKWGWSNDDMLLAFKNYPQCMFLSEKNITKKMDFLVNKIGFESRVLAEYPLIMLFSLEKRILPRCSVVWFLEQKGLLVKKPSLSFIVKENEKKFLQTFVTKFIKDVPQLLDIYQGKIDPFTI